MAVDTAHHLFVRRGGTTVVIRLYTERSEASVDGGAVLAVRIGGATRYAACYSSGGVMCFRAGGTTRHVLTHRSAAVSTPVLAASFSGNGSLALDGELFRFGGRVDYGGARGNNGTPASAGAGGYGFLIQVKNASGGVIASIAAPGGGGGGKGGWRKDPKYSGNSFSYSYSTGRGGSGGAAASGSVGLSSAVRSITVSTAYSGAAGKTGKYYSWIEFTPTPGYGTAKGEGYYGGAGGNAGNGAGGAAASGINGGAGGSSGGYTGSRYVNVYYYL